MIFGLTQNHNLDCGLGFRIDNHNIFSFIKKIFCIVTVYSLFVVAHAQVLYWRNYGFSWELTSLLWIVIFLSPNPICGHGNLRAFLSWVYHRYCHISNICIVFVISCGYTIMCQFLWILSNVTCWKRTIEVISSVWTNCLNREASVICSQKLEVKKLNILARFNTPAWQFAEWVESESETKCLKLTSKHNNSV